MTRYANKTDKELVELRGDIVKRFKSNKELKDKIDKEMEIYERENNELRCAAGEINQEMADRYEKSIEEVE